MELCKWHLAGLHDPEREDYIRTALQDKLDRAAARLRYGEKLHTEK